MANKNITVNGELITIDAHFLLDVFTHFKVLPENVVVELNGEIIPQEKHDMPVNNGDVIELVRFVGGG